MRVGDLVVAIVGAWVGLLFSAEPAPGELVTERIDVYDGLVGPVGTDRILTLLPSPVGAMVLVSPGYGGKSRDSLGVSDAASFVHLGAERTRAPARLDVWGTPGNRSAPHLSS